MATPDHPTSSIPLAILAGSDPRPGELPPEGHGKHPLSGPKGANIQIGGRPLIAVLLDAARATGRLGPMYVVGPASAYGPLDLGVSVVDAHGSFGHNARAAVETLRRQHPGHPGAFLACDVLTDATTLSRLLDRYAQCSPCDLFFPMVRAPARRQDLGASAWKPEYQIVPAQGEAPVSVLPGHLMIADLDALRLALVYRLFELAYRTRNRPFEYRKWYLLRGVLGALLAQDLAKLASLRAPTLTCTVLAAAFRGARALREGTLTRADLEDVLRRILVRSRHRRSHPGRAVRLPIVDATALAIDLDTTEEVDAAGGTLTGAP